MESQETYPVTKAGRLIGKAPNTVRTWSGEELFGPYLSPHANPEPGLERRYTERDIRILRTASILQKRGMKLKEILPRIASGEIIEELDIPEEEPPKAAESPEKRNPNLPARLELSDQIELFLRPYENQLSRLSADLEREGEELDREREARRAAELELSRLSAKLEQLDRERDQLETEREARRAAELELSRLSAKLEEKSLPWYRRLFGGES